MLWIAGGLACRASGHTQIGQIWSAPWPGPEGLAGPSGTTRFPGSACMSAGTAQDPVLPGILPGQ